MEYQIAESVGCQHYVRGCQVRCNACKRFYPCRFCHDDAESHPFPRYDTDTVKCMYCDREQALADACRYCRQPFGRLCMACKLVDGLTDDGKPIFHCDQCNCCNVGFRQFSRHCSKCEQCIQLSQFDAHLCRQVQEDCVVCLGSLRKTQQEVSSLHCGHQIHTACLQSLMNMRCPVCRAEIDLGAERAGCHVQHAMAQLRSLLDEIYLHHRNSKLSDGYRLIIITHIHA